MRRRHSLRLRVAAAFAWFGGLVSLLLASGLYFAAHDVGQRLIDETLRAELEDYMARRQRNPQSLPPASVTLHGYVAVAGATDPDIPAAVRNLEPGRHEIDLDDVRYRVAVADAQELRFYLLFNETRQQAREQRFLAYLAGGALTMILLSAAVGLWLAGRVIAPVSDLARQLGTANPDAPPPARDLAARPAHGVDGHAGTAAALAGARVRAGGQLPARPARASCARALAARRWQVAGRPGGAVRAVTMGRCA